MTIPRFDMPELTYIETDAQQIASNIISTYEKTAGRVLAQGDPIRLFLLTIADAIAILRSDVNISAQQQNLTYAVGGFLDAFGVVLNCPRLGASAAVTTLKYTLSEPLATTYTIPAGSQATNGIVYFATNEDLIIPIGAISGTVSATCTIFGEVGNGYLANQIRTQVEPLPYIDNVTNTTLTAGGADRESDEAYAERLHLVTASYSVAGPIGAYEYHTYSVSPAIVDVKVTSPTPGVVEIYPLLAGGLLPTPTILEQVAAALNAEDIRPLTDFVRVLSPNVTTYNVNFTYYIDASNQKRGLEIQNSVDSAVSEYILWQKAEIGRDINPDKLIQLVIDAGAKRVEITSPERTILQPTQIAQECEVNVVFGGYEEG